MYGKIRTLYGIRILQSLYQLSKSCAPRYRAKILFILSITQLPACSPTTYTVYFAILFSLQHIMDISCQSNIYAWITKMLFQDYNDTRNQHKLIEPCSLFRWLLLKMNDLCKSREVLICNVRPCADSGWLMAQRWRQRQQLSCRIFCVYFV